ncbi:MAG: elongation factor G [Proteobacteria bacterium]|nr:elongation factor G [Pseudomonadota bacterium]MBU1688612.1 elongation factor G [Pseudomonadota bacterium]
MQDVKLVRNVALFGHGKSGKTSLAEALLFTAGKTTRLGKVDDGSSVMDYEPEEINRHSTISSSFNHLNWLKHSVYLIDTPGDDNFLNETMYASRVADCALFVVEANLGIKSQTEKIAQFVADRGLPTLIHINKMDRERADHTTILTEMQNNLPFKPAMIHLPIGAEADFKGIIDIIRQKAFTFEGNSGQVKECEIPVDMADEVTLARETLMELVAETDDALIENFLEEGKLTDEELLTGLRAATRSGAINPVTVGAAATNLGTALLLNMINELLPSPSERPAQIGTNPKTSELIECPPSPEAPFSGLVFKTMADPYAGRLTILKVVSGTMKGDSFYNASREVNEKFSQILLLEGKSQKPTDSAGPGMIVALAKLKETVTGDTLCAADAPVLFDPLIPVEPNISYAVTTTEKKDEEKLIASITKMLEEDPTLQLNREKSTRQILISGVGQIHVEVIGDRIKRKFGVEMKLESPKVPYKETIRGKARVQGKHKKQTGGHGQFADSWIEIEPMPSGGGFVFEDKIVGGVIPKQYIPAVEKGVIEAMDKGVLAGYPMVDVKVSLVDGSFHAVDSSEMAFKISGSMAFRKGALEAKPVLLEPIMNMTIKVPQDCVGDVIGDLNGKRGKVMGMDSEGKLEVISAQAPMAEVLKYAPDLTSITGARGSFKVEFSHYEDVPSNIAGKIVEQAQAGDN